MNGTGRGRARGRGVSNGANGGPPGGPPNGNGAHASGANGANGRNGGDVTTQLGAMALDGNQKGAGRGSTRGARVRRTTDEMNAAVDLVNTKPKDLASKQGQSGEVLKLMTNHFRFVKKPDFRLYQYRIDLNIEMDITFIKKAIVYRAKEKFGTKFIFDGTVLLTTEEVYPHKQNPNGITIPGTYLNADKVETGVEITVKLVGEVHPTDHHFIHFYNLLIKKQMASLHLVQLGRSHYDMIGKKEERQWKLELFPGYTTSVRQHEDEVLMVAEISHKVVQTSSVLDKMNQMSRGGMNAVRNMLIGTIVMTKYNNKTYRVDDMDINTTASSTFPKKDGTNISFMQYYREKYNINLKDPKQPMLLSRPTEKDRRGGNNDPVMLAPELCVLTGIDDSMRANFKLMDSLAKYTKMDPPNRIQRLNDLSRRLTKECPEGVQDLKEWGMQIDPNLVTLNGRLLDPEIIYFDNKREAKYNKWPKGEKDPGADWSTGVRTGLQSAMPLMKWMFVYPGREFNNVDSFFKELQNVSRGLKLEVRDPMWIQLEDTRTGSYIAKLRECVAMRPNFIVVVIPNEKDQSYAAIKKFLCCENPVPSQVLTCSKVIGKPNKHRTFATKIAIQMTAKIGGIPWTVNIPFKSGGVMVVGFDTYHDTMKKGSSWGAMVASLDINFTRYFSDVSEHPTKQEMSDHIPMMFQGALRSYQKSNNSLPKRVIFYRDGVGDGQLKQVLDHEVQAIKKLCDDAKITLAFVVVNKRINTRFFATHPDSKVSRGPINPPSGVVVDSVVTLPERYDFFLISQSVRQGTVNPTSYNVISDNSGLKPEHIQRLTYKLCHLYYNWTGTVRVPAPCQYAHKLAYVVGESLHARPSPQLSETLYYL